MLAAALRLAILARHSSILAVSLWSPAISVSLMLKAWSPPTLTGSGYGNGSSGGAIFLGGVVRNLVAKSSGYLGWELEEVIGKAVRFTMHVYTW